jgi:hypothetical protein
MVCNCRRPLHVHNTQRILRDPPPVPLFVVAACAIGREKLRVSRETARAVPAHVMRTNSRPDREAIQDWLNPLSEVSFMLIRAGWIAVALLVMGLVFASISTYAAYLHLPIVAPALAPTDPGGQLTPGGMHELQS